ncbi:MAG: FtsH protease activity modulator HflK [Kiloniellaceae bacterium]|nr:FtsH protease activity modulator HflK [Kiloniellaceae bacterium]
MPWENKGGGGPWGGGGGSGGSGGGGPWGRGGGGSGGGPRPPDFEDFIRKGQDRFRSMLPGGGSGLGKSAYLLVGLAILLIWLFTGVYRVQTNEQGVVLRFGKWIETTEPGLNWHLPWPIEAVLTPSVTSVQQIDIGFQSTSSERTRTRRDVEEESLMLTGDQNIIDIDFTVQWKIADAGQYLFNIREPEQTVKIAAESAMREIVGRTDIQQALTEARGTVETEARTLLQVTLNDYEAGIEITDLALQDVQPPSAVIDAFNDVLRAQQDRDRARNEADRYRNDILPRARGEALRVVQGAEAYKERLENEAEGDAQRFLSVFNAYRQSPDVTRRRMYLETMQGVLSQTDKVILDGQAGAGGAVPYLPLNELRRVQNGNPSPGSAAGGSGN